MARASSMIIRPARSAPELATVADLFRAYAAALDVDLGYQDFEGELASLPGKYVPPKGELLLARDSGGTAIGCVALRPLDEPGCCEMKRLYVSPAARGSGLGRALVMELIQAAQNLGYRELRLDTLPSMGKAAALYRTVGFEEMPPYYDTPVAGTLFMRRRLD